MGRPKEARANASQLENLQANIKRIALDLELPEREVEEGNVYSVFGDKNRTNLVPRVNYLNRPSEASIRNIMNGTPPTDGIVGKLVQFCVDNFSQFELQSNDPEKSEIKAKEQLTKDHLKDFKIKRFYGDPETHDHALHATISRFCNYFVGFYESAVASTIEMMVFRIYIKDGVAQCVLITGIQKDLTNQIILGSLEYNGVSKRIFDYLTETLMVDNQIFRGLENVEESDVGNITVYRGDVQINHAFISMILKEIPRKGCKGRHNVFSATIDKRQYEHFIYQVDDTGTYIGGAGIAVTSADLRAFPFVFSLYGTYDGAPEPSMEEIEVDQLVANQLIDSMINQSVDSSKIVNERVLREINKLKNVLKADGEKAFCHPAELERAWYPVLCAARDNIKYSKKNT